MVTNILHYKMYLSMMIVIRNKQHLTTSGAEFMKKLSKSEAEFEKSAAYKKSVYCIICG